jgi:hypothetical protein
MSLFDTDMVNSRFGGRRYFWVSQLDVVASYVGAHGKELTKVQIAAQGTVAGAAGTGITENPGTRGTASRVLIWDPTRGGMRNPHLHYAGEIYILNESQWADFSKSAMSALSAKLGGAQKVTFENVMQISEATVGM